MIGRKLAVLIQSALNLARSVKPTPHLNFVIGLLEQAHRACQKVE